MNEAVIFYDPFLPELRVYINGESLSIMSSLQSYVHKPFIDWFGILFKELYREINDSYTIEFCGGDVEFEILYAMSENEQYCEGMVYKPFEVNTPLEQRLEIVRTVSGSDFAPAEIRLLSSDEGILDAIIELLLNDGLFEENDFGDKLIYTVNPGTTIEIGTDELNSLTEFKFSSSHLDAIICTQDMENDILDMIEDAGEYVFLFIVSDNTSFLYKKKNVIVFEADVDFLADLIIKTAKTFLLSQSLAEKCFLLMRDYKRESSGRRSSEYDAVRLASLTSLEYSISIPEIMYRTSRKTVQANVFPNDRHDELYVISESSAVRCEGLTVIAEEPGDAEIVLYKVGSDRALAQTNVTVKDGLLINKIELFPHVMILPVGGSSRLQIDCTPIGAVNVSDLTITADSNIVTIDDKYNVYGCECGSCRITTTVGNVSNYIEVEVLPKLEKIEVSSAFVNVKAGESVRWNYTLVPSKCYEGDLIKVVSSDNRVAVYKGGSIIGISPGTAIISVYFPNGGIKNSVKVTVVKKKLFG